MLINQKWNVEIRVITVYKAIYFAPHPLWLFMSCHLCKPRSHSLKISIKNHNLTQKHLYCFQNQTFNVVNSNNKLCKFLQHKIV